MWQRLVAFSAGVGVSALWSSVSLSSDVWHSVRSCARRAQLTLAALGAQELATPSAATPPSPLFCFSRLPALPLQTAVIEATLSDLRKDVGDANRDLRSRLAMVEHALAQGKRVD